jgi:hypothetical protein
MASNGAGLPIPAPPMSAGILDRSWKLRSLFLAQAMDMFDVFKNFLVVNVFREK